MKKFLTKIFVYLLLLSAVTLAINAYYVYKGGGFTDEAYLHDIPQSIELCNFGSSHGANGFNYEDVKDRTCFNFALHSQSLLYDYRILQHYSSNLKRGGVVFIVASYFSFFGGPEAEGKSFIAKNKRYYKFLPKELILAYDWMTDLYVNYLPALTAKGMSRSLKLFLGFETQETVSVDHKGTTSKDAELDAPKAYERHIAYQLKSGSRMRSAEAFEEIYGMIELCRELGVRPVMVTVPYLQEYTSFIKKNDPEFFGDFYSVIREIQAKTGIEYYDYAFDERFRDNYRLFINSDHLNKEGARVFTNILLREVPGIFPYNIAPQ